VERDEAVVNARWDAPILFVPAANQVAELSAGDAAWRVTRVVSS
jgi:hypothetical protein